MLNHAPAYAYLSWFSRLMGETGRDFNFSPDRYRWCRALLGVTLALRRPP